MRATSPSRKRRVGPGTEPLIASASAGRPAGESVVSAISSEISTMGAEGKSCEAFGKSSNAAQADLPFPPQAVQACAALAAMKATRRENTGRIFMKGDDA